MIRLHLQRGALACCTALVGLLAASAALGEARSLTCPPAKGWARKLVDKASGDYAPMAYTVRKSESGMRVLVARGAILQGETERLKSALRRAGRISEIQLYSAGGNSYEGMKMGRFIRRQGLATRIAKGTACFSACSMVFLGGVIRQVDPGGHYGVHMATAFSEETASRFVDRLAAKMKVIREHTKSDKGEKFFIRKYIVPELQALEQRKAAWARARANYLIEMAVSLRLMIPNIDTPANGQHWLCRKEMLQYGVINVRQP